MKTDEKALRALIEKIVAIVHPEKIILFGSASRGEKQAESDLDIMIVMPEGTHRRHTAQKLYRQIVGIDLPYEIIVATPGDLEKHKDNLGLIYHTVLTEGKLLYAA